MYLLLWLFTTRIAVYEPLDMLMRDKRTLELLPIFRRPIVVSKETTYLTEPLLPGGRGVDYVAAFNARFSKGVTFENNAVVPLLRLHPPVFKSDDQRKKFFQLLGGEIQFRKEDKLISHHEVDAGFLKRGDDIPAWKEYSRSSDGPWKPHELPIIEKWLDRNKRPLELLDEAARRPTSYVPLVSGPNEPAEWPDGSVKMEGNGDFGNLLNAKAFSLTGQGKTSEAWSRLRTQFQMAHVRYWNNIGVDHLFNLVQLLHAVDATVLVIRYDRIDRATLQRMADEFSTQAKLPLKPEDVAFCFRCEDLSSIQQRAVLGCFASGSKSSSESKPRSIAVQIRDLVGCHCAGYLIDLNRFLVDYNRMSDELSTIMKQPLAVTKAQAISALRQKWKPWKDPRFLWAFTDDFTLPWSYINDAMRLGIPLHDVYVGEIVATRLDALRNLVVSEERLKTRYLICEVEFALQLHRADHGRYPKTLSELVPKYLKEIRKDSLTNSPLVYLPRGERYLLYSLGVNGKDDSGIRPESNEQGDDIGVPWN